MRWSRLHGDMQGTREQGAHSAFHSGSKTSSEIPCRVRTTCPAAPQGAAEYRLISGKPYRLRSRVIPREVLGTPSDPVTTDPKGEADRIAAPRQAASIGNTPALIKLGSLWSAARWIQSGSMETRKLLPDDQRQGIVCGGNRLLRALVR